ncbi:BTB/POZ domain-containing protein [Ditylenchus destructor]|uniref:BTB/POZ domain-containing protein n=1 Tax=Ditylenchus destructor TaxID=166010 RepID=A0AAD4N411_9BILA|nr:BTB/POZ domain-containing protein [Ditylenchus destructor]
MESNCQNCQKLSKYVDSNVFTFSGVNEWQCYMTYRADDNLFDLFPTYTNHIGPAFWTVTFGFLRMENDEITPHVWIDCKRNDPEEQCHTDIFVTFLNHDKYIFHEISPTYQYQETISFSGSPLLTRAKLNLGHVASYRLFRPNYGFVQEDGGITVKIKIAVIKPVRDVKELTAKIFRDVDLENLFSKKTTFPHDCVLLVEGKEVYVQKCVLAMHSPKLKKLFSTHDKLLQELQLKKSLDQNPINLGHRVQYKDLIQLLAVVYLFRPITVKNVESVVKLAYRFKMGQVVNQCEHFLLLHLDDFTGGKKLYMAQKLDLMHLMAECVKKYRCVEDVRSLQDEPQYNDLNDRTRRLILDNIISANKSPDAGASSDSSSDNGDSSDDIGGPDAQKFSSSTTYAPDCTLIVEEKRIPVHKKLLALYSEYFKAMFDRDDQSNVQFVEQSMNEIPLIDKKYDEMVELLAFVYPSSRPITATNIEPILRLSDFFQMQAIKERCKDFILTPKNGMQDSIKFVLTQQYDFEDAQEKLAQRYQYLDDVLGLAGEPEFELLNDRTRRLILDNMVHDPDQEDSESSE